MASDKKRTKTIVFLHPDLGIGGAERLVVDAAVGLQNRGHRVVIFTSHCDPKHCFDEARDGTLDVRVRGNTLVPPTVLGRFAILCAILRQLHLILHIALLTRELRELAPDAFFVDQLSAGLPLLRALAPRAAPIFFYCHFPDLLLAKGRARLWKRLYRVPFDALEQWSMAFADAIAVNSDFTRRIVAQTWPALAAARHLHVVHPCVDTAGTPAATAEQEQNEAREKQGKPTTIQIDPHPWSQTHALLLSINRFERAKNLPLALRAFALLPPDRRARARLVLAGGHDPRVPENVAHHAELAAQCAALGLRAATVSTLPSALAQRRDDVDVLFVLSAPSLLKEMLLRSARLLVYTPPAEHFGIVPLEAMARGVPVLAAACGGPTETVVDGVTGWLRDPERAEEWSTVMDRVVNELAEDEWRAMGRAGVERVRGRFAVGMMAERLEGIFEGMERAARERKGVTAWLAGMGGVVGLLVAAALLGRG